MSISSEKKSSGSVINLDQGDPAVFEAFWGEKGDECAVTIKASELSSYYSDAGNVCWFLLPELGDAVRRLHRVVGNAAVDGRYVVVGTGSSQLYQAALYALSSGCPDSAQPVGVVSAAPYYSSYPLLTDFLKSGLYKWAGDANRYTNKDKKPYIEVVCSPNNPDGATSKPAVKSCVGDGRLLVHDLAYYWPHYTPITSMVDHDIMLFTFSKCTGHAGSRIGWAVVKDEEVARRMTKFIELNTIGTSKEAQLRAAKILHSICNGYLDFSPPSHEGLFEYGYRVMADRWARLREAAKRTGAFGLPEYPDKYCHFMGKFTRSQPAFAWLECKKVEDGAMMLRGHKILARSGERFGADKKFVRVSMLENDEGFEVFLSRVYEM